MVSFLCYLEGAVQAEGIRTASEDTPPVDLEKKRLS